MFLQNLNYKQKKIFLGMAKEILVADDGTIDEQEDNYLRAICSEMSLGVDDEVVIDHKDLKELFASEEETRLILVELIALAYSNGEYHQNEKKYILSIIDALKCKESILGEIEDIVKIYFETQRKIISFITSEEA